MHAKTYQITFCLILSFVFMIVLFACAEKESESLTPDRDVGETIASTLGIQPGGVFDQISDLKDFLVYDTTRVGKTFAENHSSKYVTINKTYDNSMGLWNITIEKVRGSSDEVPFAHIERRYTLQYRNTEGYAQKYYVTGLDTARIVMFKLMQAEGQFKTRRIHHMLDSLDFNWSVTEAHKPQVLLNGYYYKAGMDTISGWSRVRTSDHTAALTISNLVIPRTTQYNFYQGITGIITGSLDTVVNFVSGTPYDETSIHRDVQIMIGSGRGDITIGTKHFQADLYTGELLD
ncbi:MAG: hypothetical protein R6V77_01630 [Candidatus Cloacimonadaceae bacterium]